MTPTNENYYTPEIQAEYITNSKLKNFFGCPAKSGCEAKAMAEMNGQWSDEISDPLLIGLYVEAYFENNMDEIKEKYGEYLYKKDGSLYAKFEHANKIIQTGLTSELFMKFMQGEQQTVLTGVVFGQKFMCRLDRIDHKNKIIVDLKVIKDFDPIWSGQGKVNFIDAWGYADQLAIYQELAFQNFGARYDCYIAALTKEKEPDKEIFYVPQSRLDQSLRSDEIGEAYLESPIEQNIKRYVLLRDGIEQPKRCGHCDYCKATKVLTEVTHYNDLIK